MLEALNTIGTLWVQRARESQEKGDPQKDTRTLVSEEGGEQKRYSFREPRRVYLPRARFLKERPGVTRGTVSGCQM